MSESELSELLPCPFCGWPGANDDEVADDDTPAISCTNEKCEVQQNSCFFSVEGWNRRPSQAREKQQEGERLEKMRTLVEHLAGRFKGYLPWPDDLRDAVVRGHEAFIEDTIKKADAMLAAASAPPPEEKK